MTAAPEKILRFLSAVAVLGLALAFGATQALAQRPLGIDVSHYEGTITWTNVQSSGISFAWAKATESTDFIDPDFTVNETNAVAAGVFIGAYHYAHPELHVGPAGADLEAAYFWNTASNYIRGGGYYLMPMLDIEQDVSTIAYTKATFSLWVNEWCQDIVKYAASNGVTVKPVVYTYISYAAGTSGNGPGFNSTVTNWPLWMAEYPASPNPQTGAPSSTSPWSTWSVWQYGDTGVVPGVSGDCDQDVFNGTAANLGALVIGGFASPVITTNPQPQTVKLGTNVTFTAAATGLPAPTYQWLFNGTNIVGATSSNFSIAFVAATNAGNYSVIASNVAGSVMSSNAALALLPPAAAQFQAISVAPNGGAVQIGFTGDAFWTYTIEVSTNLTSWSALTNLTSANGIFNFTVAPATNSPQQFYRARAGP